MNHQDPELQAIAATLPLHIHFAWEDAASIEQMIQALTALADYAAQAYGEKRFTKLSDAAVYLRLWNIETSTTIPTYYWTSPAGKADARSMIYAALFAAYSNHHNRIFALESEPLTP